MKLLLTILLLATTIFASSLKTIRYKFMQDAYVGSNEIVPQLGLAPKKKTHFTFIIAKGNDGDRIIDHKNKKAWNIGIRSATKPFDIKEYRNYCRTKGNELNPKSLESLDLNLVNLILKVRNKKMKDISVFVKVKKGKNNNPNNYKIFSITQNKYLTNNLFDTPYKSYTICQRDYKSSIDFYNRLLALDNKSKREKERNIQKRKIIQVADEADQGLILEIKGPLVLVQTEECSERASFGRCVDTIPVPRWMKKDKLTFNKQKD